MGDGEQMEGPLGRVELEILIGHPSTEIRRQSDVQAGFLRQVSIWVI